METRIAVMAIIIYNNEAATKINALLHEYGSYIVGRMGIPYKNKNIFVISIVLDAPNDVIGALSGKIGLVSEVSVKTVYSKV
ncbi:MAG: TM1266 family iron-only hydrogenase system putative regulator [Lachnospiraceae bacterium]|nr:TM1266 family iron-only hydrogenase system putative regulator [Lachnospiraceae bacterium]